MFSKTLVLLSLLCAFGAFAGEDTPETRKTAAQAYLSEVAMKAMQEDLTTSIMASVPEAQQKKIGEALASMDWTAIEKVCLEATVKTYTTEEIKAMHQFYSTPVGRSVQAKFIPYMGEIMGPVNQQIQTVIMKAMQESMAPPAAKAPAEDQ